MRRAASLRSQQRTPTTSSSGSSAAEELGMVREEGGDDELRKAQRENERLRDQVQALQTMLAARPSPEQFQEIKKEFSNLDLILQGTQRENERCMAELERAKQREKTLEGYLNKLVGENWQTMVGLGPPASRPNIGKSHSRQGSLSGQVESPEQATPPTPQLQQVSNEARSQQLEQIRMLVLGMDQRLQTREDVLTKALERAEAQEARYQALAQELEVGPS
ncbi:hypothetical protein BKA62DRAFT_434370 [Auriculariales sp. MPI-PUGE-AT-0066]|nr:hypothetical protein BKA62DRAFT_434370 [Auriculariales sp. MPI-PUGE-AT-0066]